VAEYKREMAMMGTIGVVLAIVAAAVFISALPTGDVGTSSTVSTTAAVSTYTTTLPAGCSPLQDDGPTSGTLIVGTTSPVMICVQFYWFNSSTTTTLNTMSLISIQGYTEGGPFGPNDGSPFSGISNFTVTASQSQLVLGGPKNANEGAVVAYSITAQPGASGTYRVFAGGSELGTQGLEDCGPNGAYVAASLVAGNGQPNYMYSGPNLCGRISVVGTNSTQVFSIPGISYEIPSNLVVYRITSLTNSTQ
jgi:hypothetical protein